MESVEFSVYPIISVCVYSGFVFNFVLCVFFLVTKIAFRNMVLVVVQRSLSPEFELGEIRRGKGLPGPSEEEKMKKHLIFLVCCRKQRGKQVVTRLTVQRQRLLTLS